MHPVLGEVLALLFLSATGISFAAILGVRKALPLAIAGMAGAVVVRVWTSFAVWSLDLHGWNFEAWLAVGLGLIVWVTIQLPRLWRQLIGANAIMAALSAIAIWTKYGLAIGERHHSDVSQVLGMAIVVFQAEISDLSEAANNYKRGVAYPLMLALGPEGRILGGFTPLIFLVTLVTIGWVACELLRDKVEARWVVIAAGVILAFSVSVPIFRAAMFYLNSHTLMAFGAVLMVSGVLLARKHGVFETTGSSLVLLGGVIGVTARIEGILLVLVALAALASEQWWVETADRIRFFATASLTGLTLTWWIASIDSPVIERIERLGNSDGALLFLTAGSIIFPLVVAGRWFDRFRSGLLPVVAVAVLFLLVAEVATSDEPLQLVLSQWPNLGIGAGGWGTAAPAFIGSAVLLAMTRRSSNYSWLLRMSFLMIGTVLVSKTFDGGGGFGWGSFYDSVNRMWLHVMPMVALTTLIGYSELLQQLSSETKSKFAPNRAKGSQQKAPSEVDLGREHSGER